MTVPVSATPGARNPDTASMAAATMELEPRIPTARKACLCRVFRGPNLPLPQIDVAENATILHERLQEWLLPDDRRGPLPQDVLLDFAGSRLRQLLHEGHAVGRLEMGQAVSAQSDQLLLRCRGA